LLSWKTKWRQGLVGRFTTGFNPSLDFLEQVGQEICHGHVFLGSNGRLDGEPSAFPGHALQLSADDVQVITRRSLCTGERLHVEMEDAGLGFRIDAEAEVADVQRDARGSHVVTLAFDGLDRITRSSILRRAMEQERRERAGE